MLEHIEDACGALRKVHSALRPGGGLMVAVPQHRFLWSRFDERARHLRRYAAAEIADKVTNAGFRIIMTTSFVSLLLLVLSRRARPAPRGGYDMLAELRVGPVVNFVLESVLAFERLLIRCGVRFPAGGSRLLLAQRNSSDYENSIQ